jgi:hypothetical protein
MLAFINQHINRIFYGFLIFHISLMIKVILFNPHIENYMTFQSKYDIILTISNAIFVAFLFIKDFSQEESLNKKSFLQFLRNNEKLIVISLIFFIIVVVNQVFEDKALSVLQGIHLNTIAIHFLIYAITIYKGFSQYKSMFEEYNSLEHTPLTIFYELLIITKSEITELILLAAFVGIAGKINLASYITHHINTAILLILATGMIIFIGLFFLYWVKRSKECKLKK